MILTAEKKKDFSQSEANRVQYTEMSAFGLLCKQN